MTRNCDTWQWTELARRELSRLYVPLLDKVSQYAETAGSWDGSASGQGQFHPFVMQWGGRFIRSLHSMADPGMGERAGAASGERDGWEADGSDIATAAPVQPKPLRLLLCGRAANGWITSCLDVEQLFNAQGGRDCIFALPGQMTWVERSLRRPAVKGSYHCSRSPFWRVCSAVAGHFYPKVEDDGLSWSHHVAWTNLYKVAPALGNPSGAIKKLTYQHCLAILRCEIALLQPTHVLFLSGSSWFHPFLRDLSRLSHAGQADLSSCAVAPVCAGAATVSNQPMPGLKPLSMDDCFCAKELWDSYSAHAWQLSLPDLQRRMHTVVCIGSEHPQTKCEQPYINALIRLIERTLPEAQP